MTTSPLLANMPNSTRLLMTKKLLACLFLATIINCAAYAQTGSTNTSAISATPEKVNIPTPPAPSDTELLAQTNSVTQMEPVIVTGERESTNNTSTGSYTTTTATTATRTDTPIAQTPLDIEVIPRDVIQDQSIFRTKDALRNVSGVATEHDQGNGIQFENADIRGFKQQTYLNGIISGSTLSHTMPPVDMAGVEQLEVLKGPASTMYGAMEVGGIVNIIPRLPDFSTNNTVSAEFGSYNFYRGEFDTTTPIGTNQDLAYRMIGAYQESDSFRDFLHKKEGFAAPSITWKPNEDTTATFWAWYQHLNRPVDSGVPIINGMATTSTSANLSGPNSRNTQYIDDTVFGANLENKVTDDFTVREKFMLHYFDSQMDAVRLGNPSLTGGEWLITPRYDASSFNNLEFDSATEGVWKFDLGPTSHQILGGVELSSSDYYYDGLTQSLTTINVYSPLYPDGNFNPTPAAHEQNTLTQSEGAYLQEEMKVLDDHLHLLLGGRMDHAHQYNASSQTGPTGATRQEDLGFSGRVGIMYDVTPWMSPYMNICTSFYPSYGTDYLGQPLSPTTGLQYEGGLKFSLFEKKLLITTAAYQITKNNVVIADLDHPNGSGYYNMNGGTQRSQGVEYDMTGQITRELQVIGSYAYTDTATIKSNTKTTSAPPVGAPFVGIPEHSGSIWLKYNFLDGPLKHFGLGSGVFASSDFSANNSHTFNMPGYARWDAAAWYMLPLSSGQEMTFQLNVVNILNTTYYESVGGSSGSAMADPGEPLTFTGKVSLSF